jgi:Tfp pilus assembly protein PilF
MLRLSIIAVLLVPLLSHAGLHYSGETPAELPSHWRGFLVDHRSVRLIGVPPAAGNPLHLLREQYEDTASKLEQTAAKRALTADEAADLGALYVRLGRPNKAIETLRKATREHPNHFPIAANLGTAWQAQGELNEAARALAEAVRLAPPRWKPFEEAHLNLVRLRLKDPKNASAIDDLFMARQDTRSRDPKLLADDVAIVQQLALWLPSDGRLLWLLGELANQHGDVRTAASILEGVVTEFAITSPEARERRKVYRAAADEINKLPDSEHAKYRGDFVFKSTRPIGRTLDAATLPAIRPDGINHCRGPSLRDCCRPFRPRFHKHLQQLSGKRVSLTGLCSR